MVGRHLAQDVIESQFSIDQYFEFILSMGFATGIAFQVPVLQAISTPLH